jgi:REP-associated tyrosine transposase
LSNVSRYLRWSDPVEGPTQRWLGPYATTFNRVHARAGHLFQNRFKNTLVEEEVYLLELVRYIHLNPVRSRLSVTLDSLERYPWTGHAVLLGHRQLPAQDTDFVLKHFGRRVGDARRAYRRFIREGMRNSLKLDLEGGGLRRSSRGWEYLEKLGRGRECWAFDERILGGGEFVQEVLHASQVPRPTNGAGDPEAIVRALCERAGDRFKVGRAEIASSSLCRAALTARAAVSYAAVRHHGLTLAAVARQLGVSGNSIARALRRAEKLDPKLRDLRLD